MAILMGLVLGLVWYGIKNKGTVYQVIREVSQSRIYLQRDQDSKFIADWKAEDLLNEINVAREASGAMTLKENIKLNQAAMSRLSVILTENDFDGSVTGLTREKALQNAGYEANAVGELILTSFFKSNEPIDFWNEEQKYRDTLYYKNFQDVGIAVKNGDDRVDVYILLVSPKRIYKQNVSSQTSWGGPELWSAINKRRVELGVNPLKQMDFLCTIASIRLNQLLELGKLDGHTGFVPVLERSDLKETAEKYNISEFLIQGYASADEAVKGWENTMGHKALLSGGEYVWGCAYAQNTFGVAMAAY